MDGCGSGPRQKTWGWSTRVYSSDELQVERIFIKVGGFSSIHLHERKYNQFVVTLGTLAVNYFDEQNRHVRGELVATGDSLIVQPMERHQFFAETTVHGYEVYWGKDGKVDPEDIVRFSENGIDCELHPPIEDEVRFCCRCNRPFRAIELVTIELNNALRDVCMACAGRDR